MRTPIFNQGMEIGRIPPQRVPSEPSALQTFRTLREKAKITGFDNQQWKTLCLKRPTTGPEQRNIRTMHESLATEFHRHNINKTFATEDKVLELFDALEMGMGKMEYPENDSVGIIKVDQFRLHNLLARGAEGPLLRTILDRSMYPPEAFSLDHVKPLIRVIIRMDPEMLTDRFVPPGFPGIKGKPPLFEALDDDIDNILRGSFSREEKKQLIAFFCDELDDNGDKDGNDGIGGNGDSKPEMTKPSDKAILSLTMMSGSEHCVHKAIKQGLLFSDKVIKRLKKLQALDENDKPCKSLCLEHPCDEKNTTCLHLALTLPIGSENDQWARKLAEHHPNLLKERMRREVDDATGGNDTLTPIQYLKTQTPMTNARAEMKKLEKKLLSPGGIKMPQDGLTMFMGKLEGFLKRQCLANFDSNTCKEVMYPKGQGM